jgi:hypothetical protein
MPILFSWWINAIIYFFWEVHILIFGRCVLTEFEYGKNSETTFGEELLKKLHIQMKPENYIFFSKYIQAPLCIILSLIWQKVLGFEPLVF